MRKIGLWIGLAMVLSMPVLPVPGAEYYVAPSGMHQTPFDTWEKAATNIHDAVSLATGGDNVLVSNGTYRLTNTLVIATNFSLKSVNGQGVTTLYGDGSGGGFKLLVVSNANALVAGFTVTNGNLFYVDGAALSLIAGIVSNCVVTKCTGGAGGGPVIIKGGRFTSCIVSNVNPTWAVVSISGGTMEDSVITGNYGYDGSPVTLSGGTVQRCRIYKNSSGWKPGGVKISGGQMENSLVWSNSGTANSAAGGVQISGGKMVNCTVVGNQKSGGATGVKRDNGVITNCIFYGNAGSNYVGSVSAVFYSCAPELTAGVQGNLAADPLFENTGTGDFHLQSGSPCINTGTNLPGIAATTDLDGQPRAQGDIVDMGAYERYSPPMSNNRIVVW